MRIFIEWTNTYGSGLNTGVQRVVRNVVRYAPEVGREMDVECIPIVFREGRFVAPPPEFSTGWTSGTGDLRSRANALYWKISHFLVALIPDPRVRTLLLANKHHPGLARCLVWLAMPAVRLLRVLGRFRRVRQSEYREQQVGSGDWLLLADGPGDAGYRDAIATIKDRGAHVAAIVYDLIPVTNPRFFEPRNRQTFFDWMVWAARTCDAFCCISRSAEGQLVRFLRNQLSDRELEKKRIGSFPLGVELDQVHRLDGIRGSLKSLFEQDVYLTVGTLDPRKNHVGLLAACELAWQRGFRGALLIAGRVGWLCEDAVQKIVALKAQSRPVFHIQDISDIELEFCYENSRALVFPSLAEGFGLPLIEALQRSLPVLASDIPVFREIGRDDVTYFDPHNPEQLAQLLLTFKQPLSVSDRPQRAECRWPSWRESTAALIGLIGVSSGRSDHGARAATDQDHLGPEPNCTAKPPEGLQPLEVSRSALAR